MQRLLILTELYYPEQTSTGYFLTKIAEGLAEQYAVKVVTGPPTQLLMPCEGVPKIEIRNNVEIHRCQGTFFDRNKLMGRLVNLVTRSAAILWKSLLLSQRDDIVLVVTNPPLLPFAALLLKWIKGIEFVLLIHDVYPEVLVATGLCQPSSFLVKIGEAMNRILYGEASTIVTLGRDMTKLAKAKLSKNENKIYCIPNWGDGELIKPGERVNNPLLQKLEVAEKFVVLYAGNMGKTHGIEDLVGAAKSLQNDSNFHFIFSGFGSKKKWLQEYILTNKLGNVSILDPCPSSELGELLNACDVAVISFVPGMAGVSVPSRMYNQMAAGKPIIAVADDWSELAEAIEEEEIGWVVQPGDVASLIQTIQLAAQKPQLLAQMGLKAAQASQSKYTFTQVDKAYKKLFEKLFDRV